MISKRTFFNAVLIWSVMVPFAGAATFTSAQRLIEDYPEDDPFRLELPAEVLIVVEEDAVYAEGGIFMEYDFFISRVSEGMELIADGAISILEDLNEELIPEFNGYESSLGIAWSQSGAVWIGAGSSLDVPNFISGENIYIVDRTLSSAVPLPGSAVLLLSGLGAALGLRRQSRSHQ